MTQLAILLFFASLASAAAAAELPEAIAAPDALAVMQVHAEGAQIYECKADAAGHLSWQFREPIASLMQDGKTIGRHYTGPAWAIGDSVVTGKATGRAPGASAKDIPWLRLEVTSRQGGWPLSDVTAVQRVNTIGGALEGDCAKPGDLRSVSYSADYIFLKKTN
jgi:hypothetical protein